MTDANDYQEINTLFQKNGDVPNVVENDIIGIYMKPSNDDSSYYQLYKMIKIFDIKNERNADVNNRNSINFNYIGIIESTKPGVYRENKRDTGKYDYDIIYKLKNQETVEKIKNENMYDPRVYRNLEILKDPNYKIPEFIERKVTKYYDVMWKKLPEITVGGKRKASRKIRKQKRRKTTRRR
jgi:hypothetical protein